MKYFERFFKYCTVRKIKKLRIFVFCDLNSYNFRIACLTVSDTFNVVLRIYKVKINALYPFTYACSKVNNAVLYALFQESLPFSLYL